MEHLRVLVERGRLTPGDQVRQGSEGFWVNAGDVGGLFSANDPQRALSEGQPLPVAKPIKKPLIKAKPAPSRPSGAWAQPAKPAGSPAARATAIAPGQAPPVPTRAAAATDQDPLEAIAEEAEATLRITDHDSRAGHGSVKTAEQRKKEQEAILKIALGAFGVAVVIVGIVLLVKLFGGSETVGGLDNLAKRMVVREAAKKAAEPPQAATPADSPPREGVEVNWCDAAKSSIEHGDVTVRIVSAVIGRPDLVAPTGQVVRWNEPLLMITVELKNTHKTNKATYSSWGVASLSNLSMALTDNLARRCPIRTFPGVVPKRQLTGNTTIEPGGAIEDVLVFLNPDDDGKVKYLRLQLPAAAFGDKGLIGFEIPWDMVAKSSEPGPKRPKPKAPPGGTPSGGTQQKPADDDDPAKVLKLEETFEEGKRLEEGKKKPDPMEEDDGETKIERQHDKTPGAGNEQSAAASSKPEIKKKPGKPNAAEDLLKKRMF